MKKYLHGRRHLRARRSVQAGREKRMMHKVGRAVKAIQSIDWMEIGQAIRETMDQMIKTIIAMGPALRRAAESIPARPKEFDKALDQALDRLGSLEADHGLS